jgi:hypothetical protein
MDGVCGAELFAGAAFAFGKVNAVLSIDGILQRHGLGIFDIGRLALVEALIVFIGNFFRTFFRASAAGDALVHVNVAGVFFNGDVEIADLTIETNDFRQGVDLDI